MLPLPPDLTGPDCRFPDAVLRSSPDAYSLPLWQNVSAGAPISSHSGQISMPFDARSDGERLSGQSNLLWYHVHPTLPDRNPFSTWAPVTVLCRRKPHGPIAQQTKWSQLASLDLPSAPLSPSPMPAYCLRPVCPAGQNRHGNKYCLSTQSFREPLPAAVSNDMSLRDNKKGGDTRTTVLWAVTNSLPSLFSETRPPRKCDVCFRFLAGSALCGPAWMPI